MMAFVFCNYVVKIYLQKYKKVVLLYILQICFSTFVFGICVFVSLLLITCILQICLSNFGIWVKQKKIVACAILNFVTICVCFVL